VARKSATLWTYFLVEQAIHETKTATPIRIPQSTDDTAVY
jgi:hypothetical protein